MQLNSLDEIKQAARKGAPHWFDKATLRFFSSRASERVYPTSAGAYFVTSERFDYAARRPYTARFAYGDTGEIDTPDDGGGFQYFASASGAHARARKLAERDNA